MKRCEFCGTTKDLKLFSYKDDTREEIYICIDCLHKQTREGRNENVKYNRKNILS